MAKRDEVDVEDVLDEPGEYVEPDVRDALKRYFRAMGMTKSEGKTIKIKVSELRALVREALGEASTVASRQSMMTAADEEPLCDCNMGEDHLPECSRGMKESFALKELFNFEENLDEKKYDAMAKQIHDAWTERGADVDWARVVDLFARNRTKNVGVEVDRNKLYEKVLTLVEKDVREDRGDQDD